MCVGHALRLRSGTTLRLLFSATDFAYTQPTQPTHVLLLQAVAGVPSCQQKYPYATQPCRGVTSIGMVGGDTNHGDQEHQPWRPGKPTMATKDTIHSDQGHQPWRSGRPTMATKDTIHSDPGHHLWLSGHHLWLSGHHTFPTNTLCFHQHHISSKGNPELYGLKPFGQEDNLPFQYSFLQSLTYLLL